MNKPEFDDAGIAAGRALVDAPLVISEEDRRRLEEAWNDPKYYNLAMEADVVTAGYVPKPTVDPDRPLVPSEAEIEKLPRLAQVAFAARCVRRVLPFGRRSVHFEALNRSVVLAGQAAAGGRVIATSAGLKSAVLPTSDWVAQAAFHTAAAAAMDSVTGSVRAVTDAVIQALSRAATVGTVEIIITLTRDFDRLLRLSEQEKWTNDTPVPPSVFGPMWEGTPPPWWTDDVLPELPAEPASPTYGSVNEHAAPSEDAAHTQ